MKSFSKPIYVLLMSLLALALSFLILERPTFELNPGQTFTTTVSTLIVPHFDMAAVARQDILYRAAEKVSPKTIILLSPNHFNSGGYDVITTNQTWRLSNAYIESDQAKIAKLNLPIVETAFEREHGIRNILDPLNKAFPDAKIIPIIIKPNLTQERMTTLANQLDKVCPKSCLLVASVDFSHYQPGALAEVHDQFALKALNNLDENLTGQTEVDSRESILVALNWARQHQTEKFVKFENNNSGQIENAPDAESTSFMTGWFERGKTTPNTTQTFIAGRNLNQYPDARFLQGVDQKIELTDERSMALLCRDKSDYCGLNQLFWNAPFWRETQNGLVVAGVIRENQYKLVLLPTDNNGKLLRGDNKLAVINQIRQNLKLTPVSIGYGYDILNVSR